MELIYITPAEYQKFILILVRVSTIVFLFPIFSSPVIPNTLKAAMALMLTFFVFPMVTVDTRLFPANTVQTGIMIVSELFVGLTMALIVRLFFASIQLAGLMTGFQMGFGMINVLDPQTGTQVSILEQIGFWTVLLVFILLNGHLIFIHTLIESFDKLSIGIISLDKGFLELMMKKTADMFILSVKIGAPPITALLLTSASFGLMAKFEPRMNILIVGFPLKIGIGLVFFGFTLQIVLIFAKQFVNEFHGTLIWIINSLRG